ncbi:MAG: 5-formyltetrahydrofolate cyclo-ligase [Gammaproteobacteria bacterium]|nr:MAG: 5-formyltetrahydrofolate cyclo-ligase [Gammaproteobacteria bacterium]
MNQDLHKLRTQLKARRALLSDQYIETASQKFSDNFWQMQFTKRAQRIAVYMPTRGEIDCQPIIDMAWMRKKRIFAPILRGKQINFAPLNPDSKLVLNRYNILEPVYSKCSLIKPRQLDIVIVPLLAFDSNLNRLGMGGGYYDRSFAFSKTNLHWRHPRLVGAAYSFQHVDSLQPTSWDVPLHCVITEKESVGSY